METLLILALSFPIRLIREFQLFRFYSGSVFVFWPAVWALVLAPSLAWYFHRREWHKTIPLFLLAFHAINSTAWAAEMVWGDLVDGFTGAADSIADMVVHQLFVPETAVVTYGLTIWYLLQLFDVPVIVAIRQGFILGGQQMLRLGRSTLSYGTEKATGMKLARAVPAFAGDSGALMGEGEISDAHVPSGEPIVSRSETIVFKQRIPLGQRLHTLFMLVKIGAVIWLCLFIYSITPAFVASGAGWTIRHALKTLLPF